MNSANPLVIRCVDRNDGKHPRGGETKIVRGGKRVCKECGREVTGRHRPRRVSSRGMQRIAERDYEGR